MFFDYLLNFFYTPNMVNFSEFFIEILTGLNFLLEIYVYPQLVHTEQQMGWQSLDADSVFAEIYIWYRTEWEFGYVASWKRGR